MTIDKQFLNKDLNEVQKAAVNWDTGPFLLLAGPGSGKTRVITFRVAKILEESPDKKFNILVLTFTTKAADELRNRLNMIVESTKGRVFIGTFHSFALNILRQHGRYVNVHSEFKIYKERQDLQKILSKAVHRLSLEHPSITTKDQFRLDLIHRIENRLVNPEDVPKLFKDPKLGEKISVIYKGYLNELQELNVLDYDTSLLKAYNLLANYPAIGQHYREIYKYIFIDEFQDTNFAQYGFIRELMGEKFKEIFIAADDDQIIYEWNGASHKRIDEFKEDYSPTIKQLPINYRCPEKIVEIANKLISYNDLRDTKEPISPHKNNSSDNKIIRTKFNLSNVQQEAQWIAKDIKNRFNSDHHKIVILGRTKKLLNSIDSILKSEGLNAYIFTKRDSFESKPIRWIIETIELATEPKNFELLNSVVGNLSLLLDIEYDDLMINNADINDSSNILYEWVSHISNLNIDILDKIANNIRDYLITANNFKKFSYRMFDIWDSQTDNAKNQIDEEFIEYFTDYKIEKEIFSDSMSKIQSNYGDIIPIETFLQEMMIRPIEIPPPADHVLLMTIHSSKGKEFNHVYIPGLVDDIIPSFQSLQSSNNLQLEEERRNLYVAITRTKFTLTLTNAKEYWGWKKDPSRFLNEMGLKESNV